MKKYRNKYRIESHRMPNWDYSGNGIYFLTIVTQNRICNLGKIVKTHGRASLRLSDYGKIVETEFLKSFEIRNELFLDEFIIMPNHLHIIVVLNKPEIDLDFDGTHEFDRENGTDGTDGTHELHELHVETHGRASLQPRDQPQPRDQQPPNPFIRKPKSISSFMAGFKSSVNSKIDDYIDDHKLNVPKYNRNNHFFQSNYHDHIIRNNAEFERIKNYIIHNPENWENDKFNKENSRNEK